jgi:hypothetical protein
MDLNGWRWWLRGGRGIALLGGLNEAGERGVGDGHLSGGDGGHVWGDGLERGVCAGCGEGEGGRAPGGGV